MAESLRIISKTTPDIFSDLYCNVIKNLYSPKSWQFLVDVKEAAKSIRRVKCESGLEHEVAYYANIKCEKPAVRCSYMYLYSVLHAISVYSEFFNYLRRDEYIMKHFSSKKTLKICCIAGGPAIEAVAIIRAISDAISRSTSGNSNSPVDVYVTVVDIHREWKIEEKTVIKALNESGDLFRSKNMRFHADFLKANLLKPFKRRLRQKIKEADITTVVRFANAVQQEAPAGFIHILEEMMKTIIDCMDEETCLFMLDTAEESSIYNLIRVVSKYPSDFQLQQSLYKNYSLSPKILQTMEALMSFRGFAKIPTLFPTRSTKVSSCIWFKKSITLEIEKEKPVSVKSVEEKSISVKSKKKKPISVKTKKAKFISPENVQLFSSMKVKPTLCKRNKEHSTKKVNEPLKCESR